jgi:GTP-binding protein HflX
MLPRLTGRGVLLSRLGGGIGTRGPGETKLEVDRRRIRHRITVLTRKVEDIVKHRHLQRESRSRRMLPLASLVGYTNAGKSTLLNALTHAEVAVADQLFATLDPTIRKVELPGGPDLLLTDTVGFIRNLPHQLVVAFRATLEEVVHADLLVHVVDASHPDMAGQIEAVQGVLVEIKAGDKPTLTVFNKIDQAEDRAAVAEFAERYYPSCLISARTGQGLERLMEALVRLLRERMVDVEALVPYAQSALLARVHERGKVFSEDYQPEGVALVAQVPADLAAQVRQFSPEAPADDSEAEP